MSKARWTLFLSKKSYIVSVDRLLILLRVFRLTIELPVADGHAELPILPIS